MISIFLLLFGNRKWYQDPNMVYAHCPTVDAGIESEIKESKGIFNHCCIGQNTSD
ncbi:MAG: hypothetical protein JSS78_08850 [Bacteroidetes bacterium]|nr:hypothetical protein [Bacteroidota bacterium]